MVRGGAGECLRPWPRIAVEPYCLHSGLRGADDVGQRIIADVQHPVRLDAGEVHEMSEDSRGPGLAAPAALAVTWPANKSARPQRCRSALPLLSANRR